MGKRVILTKDEISVVLVSDQTGQPRISEAAFTATAQGGMVKTDLSRAIEAAMSAEVARCLEAGITDPQEILTRKLAVRASVKATMTRT